MKGIITRLTKHCLESIIRGSLFRGLRAVAGLMNRHLMTSHSNTPVDCTSVVGNSTLFRPQSAIIATANLKVILAALLFAATPYADADLESSPTELYSLKKLMTDKAMINIVVVKDIVQACEKESRELGLGGFGYSLSACSFWSRVQGHHSCTIFVPENTNNDTLGHEYRHCIQGHFH